MDLDEQARLENVVDGSVAGMMEHFDSVQVFVTRRCPEDNQTVAYHKGDGDWYARYGLVSTWLKKQDRHAQREVDDEREEDKDGK